MNQGPYEIQVSILRGIAQSRTHSGDPIKQTIDYILSNLSENTTQAFFMELRKAINPLLEKVKMGKSKSAKAHEQKNIDTVNAALDDLQASLPLVSPRKTSHVIHTEDTATLESTEEVGFPLVRTKAVTFSNPMQRDMVSLSDDEESLNDSKAKRPLLGQRHKK